MCKQLYRKGFELGVLVVTFLDQPHVIGCNHSNNTGIDQFILKGNQGFCIEARWCWEQSIGLFKIYNDIKLVYLRMIYFSFTPNK
jgi:hypothetical protein